MKCENNRYRKATFENVFAGFSSAKEPPLNEMNENQLNLLVLGFDSLSRVAFERFMPKTKEVLKDELNAVFFDKYTILGDGTPPGIELQSIPFITFLIY